MADSQAEMEEKLKSMSPEELSEFQKKQCIFCQIISGKVQSRRVYSDSEFTAFLDINPANPGHILLMPNEHYPILPLMPDELIGKMFRLSRGLSNALLKALKAEGTTIFLANGLVAGQKATHVMVHIIPRMPNDGIEFKLPSKQLTEQDMQEVFKRVKTRLNEILGVKEVEQKGTAKQDKKEPLPTKVETKQEQKKPVETKKSEVDLDSIAGLFK